MSGIYVQYPSAAGGGGTLSSVSFSVGLLDGQGATPQGGSVSSNSVFLQSATAVFPGLVNSTTQTFGGVKTFQSGITSLNIIGSLSVTGVISGSNISGSNTSDLSLAVVGTAPNANAGSIAAGQILTLQPADATHGGVVSTASQTFSGVKTFSNQTLIADGTAAAPGIQFTSQPGAGLYRIGSGDIAIALGSALAFEMNLVNSTTCFGFGGAASASALTPLSAYGNSNSAVNFNYSNYNQGTSAQTILYVGAGASGANGFTIENHGFSNEAYTGGGGVFSAGPNLSFLNICAENTTGYITFNVFGRSLATERMRLTATALTLNGGVNHVTIGTSSTGIAITQSAPPSGSAYSMTWPSTVPLVNQVLISAGSGSALNWAQVSLPNTIGSVSSSQLQPVGSRTIGSITYTSSTGGNAYTLTFPGSLGQPQQALTTSSAGALAWVSSLTNPFTASGDIIVSSGTSTITNLAIGTSAGGKVLTVSTGSLIQSWQTLTAPTKTIIGNLGSNSYFTPAGCKFIKVTVTGGGGGGGGVASSAATAAAGGGGGGGATAIKWLTPTPLQVYPCIVGTSGPGGLAGNNPGTAGSQSSFNGTIIGGGGGGGGGSAASAALAITSTAGAGGSPNGFDLGIAGGGGNPGFVATTATAIAGFGGSSIYAGNGQPLVNASQVGTAATGNGGGGCGASQVSNGGAFAGGAGGTGVILVEEFYQ